MRYINLRSTYLLIYLLTLHVIFHERSLRSGLVRPIKLTFCIILHTYNQSPN